MTAYVPISSQIEEADRTLRERDHLHPILIGKNRLRPETSAHQIEVMAAIARTLRWLGDNRDWIMKIHAQRQPMERQRDDDIARAEADPVVQTIRRELSGAEVVDVRRAEP